MRGGAALEPDLAPSWGIVSTVKADLAEILAFAAHHAELGAHRIYIYLDDPQAETVAALKAHPKIRVTACDAAYWRKTGKARPLKHQVRQGANASHAYRRRAEVDWLAHIDVDEFLWPETSVAAHLAALPATALSARVRPIEALAGGDGCGFKALPPGDSRAALSETLYPTYGRYLRGGFMSHVAGKLFVRTDLGEVDFRIHNMDLGGIRNPQSVELAQVDLCHLHAKPWEEWRATYRYRFEKGSYRPELPPAISRENGGMNLHELFAYLEATEGEAGLRAFFDEVCADTPALRARLQAQGLLRHRDLDLAAKMQRHFPDFR